jgi:TolC family type I secretion outer membrane protein
MSRNGFVLLLAAGWSWCGSSQVLTTAADTLTIERAVDLGLQHHPSLRAAEAGIRAASAGRALAMSTYFPSIAFNASATHTEGVFVFNPVVPARYQIYSSYTGGLSAQQVLFDFGRTIGKVSGNSSFTDAARADYTSTREQVKLNVQIAYFGLLAAQQVARVTQEAVGQAEKHLVQAKAFYAVGRRPQFDVTKAEVDLANANVNLIKATNVRDVARVQLENAMGVEPPRPYIVSEPLFLPAFDAGMDSAKAAALQRRPELLAARARVEGNRALARAAWSQHLPTLSAIGGWTWNGFQPSPLYPRWNAGLQLTLPLFLGFSIDAQVQQADAVADAAQATLDTQTQAVMLDVEQAYLGLKEAGERRVATAKLVEQAEQNFVLADRQYAAGVGTPLDVTDAQVSRSNAHITDIQARYDYTTSLVRLRRAMGIVD